MNTNKGSIVKQSGNDVEGCQSEKVLVQPNMRVFLQYSVKIIYSLFFSQFYPDQMTKMKQNPLDWNRRRRRRTRRRRCCNWFKRRRICITQWGASPCTAGQKE